MIDIKMVENTNIMEFHCRGALTHEDYQDILIPFLDDILSKPGPYRVFCDLREMEKVELKAMWDDLQYAMKHLKDYKKFERFATVGDQSWIAYLMKMCRPF